MRAGDEVEGERGPGTSGMAAKCSAMAGMGVEVEFELCRGKSTSGECWGWGGFWWSGVCVGLDVEGARVGCLREERDGFWADLDEVVRGVPKGGGGRGGFRWAC